MLYSYACLNIVIIPAFLNFLELIREAHSGGMSTQKLHWLT